MTQQLIFFTIGLVVGMAIIAVPAALSARSKTKTFQRVFDSQDRMLARADARVVASDSRLSENLDRFYGRHNLAPGGVDMKELYDERRAQEKEQDVSRRNGGPVRAPRIGLVDQAQDEMERRVAERSS